MGGGGGAVKAHTFKGTQSDKEGSLVPSEREDLFEEVTAEQ